MHWMIENGLLIVSLGLLGLGVGLLMPTSRERSRVVGWLLAMAGVGLLASRLHVATGPLTESILFWIFATGAIVCGILMITSRNPVYAALWFALVTFSSCGLFLLQSAPFLAAATVIVYAGAIIVTFLFVIMLAQQAGATLYDQRSRQPMLATLLAFVLLGSLIYTIKVWDTHQAAAAAIELRAAITTNELSRPALNQPVGTMHGLGRALFSDYLFAVELAGTLLLIAVIGAIAMAPRRPEGTL